MKKTSIGRWLAIAIIVTAASLPAIGDTYYGMMTCTVTSSNDPKFTVGDTFQNFYQFDLSSIDDTYYTSSYGNPDKQQEVFGNILQVGAAGNSNSYISTNIGFANGAGDGILNHITVTDGQVTGFRWDNQVGQGDTLYSNNAFSFYSSIYVIANSPADPGEISYLVSGTIDFSAPSPSVVDFRASSVPEGGSTLLMLVGSLISLVMIRRRLVVDIAQATHQE